MQNNQQYTETQSSIGAWAKETFEENKGFQQATIKLLKLEEEYGELLNEMSLSRKNPTKEDIDAIALELADMLVVMYGIAECLNIDLLESVDKKMEINRRRKWKKQPSGNFKRDREAL